jgi:hypothetical protein
MSNGMATDGSTGLPREVSAVKVRSAVGLELLPGVFLLASCLAGLGWIVAGRTLVDCVVMMARVFYLVVVLATVLVLAGAANWPWGLVLFAAAVFAAGILAPIVSALALLGAMARQSFATRDDEGT